MLRIGSFVSSRSCAHKTSGAPTSPAENAGSPGTSLIQHRSVASALVASSRMQMGGFFNRRCEGDRSTRAKTLSPAPEVLRSDVYECNKFMISFCSCDWLEHERQLHSGRQVAVFNQENPDPWQSPLDYRVNEKCIHDYRRKDKGR